MSEVERSLTFTDLMSKVGYVLFYWSSFELELTKAIVSARKRLKLEPDVVPNGLNDRLAHWIELASRLPEYAADVQTANDLRDQAIALRDVRNLIVHGLVGGNAQPRDGEAAYIRCAIGGIQASSSASKTFGMADLEHFIQGMDACRRGLIQPTNFNYRVPPDAYK